MSNLATMVMEGASLGFGSAKLDHSYDHENGAGLIAMECAEALHSIFEAEFYVPNTCTIQAAMEGATSVEESTQASVMEASIKSAFEKIKRFFITLKEKVKDFLNNIRRYLTGIFGNDEKWVKTYEQQLKNLNKADLKGYKIKMYSYSDLVKEMSESDIKKDVDSVTKDVNDYITTLETDAKKSSDQDIDSDPDALRKAVNTFYLEQIKKLAKKSVDEDEFDKAVWSMLRSNANSEADMSEVEVASIFDTAVETLKTSTKALDTLKTLYDDVDKAYNTAIKTVNDTQKAFANVELDDSGKNYMADRTTSYPTKDGEEPKEAFPKAKYASNVAAALRLYSQTVSKVQTAHNKRNNAIKAAMVERNNAYKKALVGSFSYVKKNKGGKKS